MTSVLLLGGTGWLGGRIAASWLASGASVTCLARGGRPAPDGARLIVADRDASDAYDAVREGEWDEVVDVSSSAEQVRAAAAALAGAARHLTYVSSVSVYADSATRGTDEGAEVVAPARAGDPPDYAREKSAAEAAVRGALPRRAAVVRPGLIVGPGDPTDRFGYWVSRFAMAGDGPVLIPDAGDAPVQVIDVDDLAAFIVGLGRDAVARTVNAVGEVVPFGRMIAAAREAAGHTGELVALAPDELLALGIGHWAGPRSLPLWLPADMPGFATRSHAEFLRCGGRLRPLRDTLDATLADERRRGLDRPRRAGLTRTEELEVLTGRHR